MKFEFSNGTFIRSRNDNVINIYSEKESRHPGYWRGGFISTPTALNRSESSEPSSTHCMDLLHSGFAFNQLDEIETIRFLRDPLQGLKKPNMPKSDILKLYIKDTKKGVLEKTLLRSNQLNEEKILTFLFRADSGSGSVKSLHGLEKLCRERERERENKS